MPGFIPFMVKLQKWFETPDKVIFLLEHAAGGRLVDFVLNYQSKRISFVTPPDESTPVEEIIPEIGKSELNFTCKIVRHRFHRSL